MKNGVFLPGYACLPYIWNAQSENLADKYQLQTVAWPNELIGNFEQISDFAEWFINDIYDGREYDFIVGHSMGGLVALFIARLIPAKVKKVILVESFITSPTPYFQNLLMESADLLLKNRVINMLKAEQKYYSPQLSQNLRDLDLTDMLQELESDMFAIYGDRGKGDFAGLVENLKLSSEILDKINIRIVHDACHFPMLEKPMELTNKIIDILS